MSHARRTAATAASAVEYKSGHRKKNLTKNDSYAEFRIWSDI